jgi:hypothetical protein
VKIRGDLTLRNLVVGGNTSHSLSILGTGDTTAVLGSGTLRGPAATGTNIASTTLTFDVPTGTGTGAEGKFIWRTAPAGSTGTTPHVLAEKMRLNSAGLAMDYYAGDCPAWTKMAIQGATNDNTTGVFAGFNNFGQMTTLISSGARIDLMSYDNLNGAVATLGIRSATPAAGQSMGHYAYTMLSSAPNLKQCTGAYLLALVIDPTETAVETQIQIGWMKDQDNTAANTQPNRFVTFGADTISIDNNTPLASADGKNFFTHWLSIGSPNKADCPDAVLAIREFGNQWSAFNYGPNIIVNPVNGTARHPMIGIADLFATNFIGIGNNAGTLQVLAMPLLGDTTTGPPRMFSCDRSGNIRANSFIGSSFRQWRIQPDAGQPATAMSLTPQHFVKQGISAMALTVSSLANSGAVNVNETNGDGQFLSIKPTATTNSDAGWNSATTNLMFFNFPQFTTIVIKTGPNAADIQNIRFFIGWFSATPMAADSTNSIHGVGFRWSSVADAAAGWKCITGNGTTMTATAISGLPALAANTKYVLRIDTNPDTVTTTNSTVEFSVQIGASVYSQTISTTLPGMTTQLFPYFMCRTLANASPVYKNGVWIVDMG